jgi:hypothetical protein
MNEIDPASGEQWADGMAGTFAVRDRDVARRVDLLDLLASAWRPARA